MNIAHSSRLIRPALSLLLGIAMVLVCTAASAQPRGEEKDYLLSEEDIEMIKVYEVHLDTKTPPRVVIPRDVLRDFIDEYKEDDEELLGKSNQDRFLRAKGHIQLGKLFEHRARDYYKHVRIRSSIDSLREFGNIHRRHILEYFQPYFGSGAVDGLFLFPRGRDAERIEMTNFYILTQTEIDGKPIIDRFNPSESLLLQWALPRDAAKFPAPEDIEGWEPKFKSMQDERFKELVTWIESLIEDNQGESYGINYKAPQHKKPRNNQSN